MSSVNGKHHRERPLPHGAPPVSLTRLPAITDGRDTWYVDRWTIAPNKKLTGRLMDGAHCVRESFTVKVDDEGKFKVDIGTGSGVKIAFQVVS